MKYLSLLSLILVTLILISCQRNNKTKTKPNILIAIADDQSYPHTGIYGFSEIKTPAFDYVARNGVLLNNAPLNSPFSLFYGQVIDMFYVDIWEGFVPSYFPLIGGSYLSLWPVFNIADSSIFVGVLIIILFQKKFVEYL